MNKWDMITKPKFEDEKWKVSIVNGWTKEPIKDYTFDNQEKAKEFYDNKAKELAFRGMK